MNENDSSKTRVSAKEQRGVLMDIVEWLRGKDVLPQGIRVNLSDLALATNAVSVVPLKGIKRSKSYACGGYEVYCPFGIYYRTAAESNNDTDRALKMLDNVGDLLDNGEPPLKLSDSREVIECYQKTTSVKYKQEGGYSDFLAEFVLVYSRDE